MTFEVQSRVTDAAGAWTLHASGRLALADTEESTLDLGAARARCADEVGGEEFYRRLAQRGNDWGPCFRGLAHVWRGPNEAVAEVRAPQALTDDLERYRFHPALADAAGHALAATIPLEASAGRLGGAFVGGALDRFVLYRAPRGRLFTHARRRDASGHDNVLMGDVRLVDETGTVVAEVQGARLWYLDAGAGPVMDDTLARRLYAIQWRPAPMTTVPSPRTGRWLIFADADGVGAAVAARLSGEGAGCVLVQPGERYEPLSPDRFLVRPGDREDIRRLLTTVLEGPGCAGIVHLWSLDGKVSADATAADLAAAQRLGCGSLLPLIQELAAARRPGRLPLWLVTRGAQPAGGVVAPDTLTAASVWGMGRTLAVEHADLWGGLVDLDPHAAAEQAAAMLDAQLLSADGEDQVAFRGDERFVARLVRTSSPRANRPARWRPDASYLITGGLGGLGLQVARWMVEQGARRIVLLGRSGLPPRGDWSAVDPASRTGRRISAVRELEALGASVHLAAVDVADEPALRHFLDAFRREAWPPIRGVVHAAGTVHYGPLVQTTEAQLDDVLRSKTTGAWLLHRLLAGDALDFFVLFSSASGVLSSPLVGAYAAANTFLDALAHHRVGEGQPALSIDWGLWAGAGMAEQVDADGLALLTARGMGSLPPEQALEALGAFLSSAAVQVGVIPVNWPVWRERYPMFTAAPFLADVLGGEIAPTVSGEATAVREDLLALEPAARAEAVRDRLRAHAAAVLRLDPATIDVNEPLTAFGIDSLMAVELKNRVDRDLGLSIPLVHYLDGSGIERLAGALLDSAASARPVRALRGGRRGERAAGSAAGDVGRRSRRSAEANAGRARGIMTELSADAKRELLARLLRERAEQRRSAADARGTGAEVAKPVLRRSARDGARADAVLRPGAHVVPGAAAPGQPGLQPGHASRPQRVARRRGASSQRRGRGDPARGAARHVSDRRGTPRGADRRHPGRGRCRWKICVACRPRPVTPRSVAEEPPRAGRRSTSPRGRCFERRSSGSADDRARPGARGAPHRLGRLVVEPHAPASSPPFTRRSSSGVAGGRPRLAGAVRRLRGLAASVVDGRSPGVAARATGSTVSAARCPCSSCQWTGPGRRSHLRRRGADVGRRAAGAREAASS